MLFVPIAFAEIGDGLSQPAAMAAALSIYPRLAGTASGLMGFLQMTVAALGSFVVALLPHDSALGLIAVFGGLCRAWRSARRHCRGGAVPRARQADPACSGASRWNCRRQLRKLDGRNRHDRRNP